MNLVSHNPRAGYIAPQTQPIRGPPTLATHLDTKAAPPMGTPKEVVRQHGLAFARDKMYRTVVYVNLVFLVVIFAMNYLLDLPRALEPFAALLIYPPLAIGQWRVSERRGGRRWAPPAL